MTTKPTTFHEAMEMIQAMEKEMQRMQERIEELEMEAIHERQTQFEIQEH